MTFHYWCVTIVTNIIQYILSESAVYSLLSRKDVRNGFIKCKWNENRDPLVFLYAIFFTTINATSTTNHHFDQLQLSTWHFTFLRRCISPQWDAQYATAKAPQEFATETWLGLCGEEGFAWLTGICASCLEQQVQQQISPESLMIGSQTEAKSLFLFVDHLAALIKKFKPCGDYWMFGVINHSNVNAGSKYIHTNTDDTAYKVRVISFEWLLNLW